MAITGRPRGYEINPDAIEDLLEKACMSKAELCEVSEISPSQLSDMLHRQKGTNLTSIRKMAEALQCRPGTIAPALTKRFIAQRRTAA